MSTRHSQAEHANLLARYLPTGPAWQCAFEPTANVYKLLQGLAVEWQRLEDARLTLKQEIMPDTTTLFLNEWESALGIPDGCLLSRDEDGATRLDQIVAKLALMHVDTGASYEALAAQLGFDVTVSPGGKYGTFPYTFPMLFISEPRFTIIVWYNNPSQLSDSFPYTFPFTFGLRNIVKCVFEHIKPANCQVLYKLAA